MLPAQTQEFQPEMAPVQHTPTPTVYGFGKVLTSIQGLQQRLENFSVEDVSLAESDAKNLIQQLSVLQDKLECLAELKKFVVSANAQISEIPAENFDQIAPDGLENHPQLHAIVQASKLIRFHRIMKAAKAGAESISFDPESGVLNIAPSAAPDRMGEREAELSPPSLGPEFSHSFDSQVEARSESTATQAGDALTEPIPTDKDHEWVFSTDTEPQTSNDAVADHIFELAPAESQRLTNPDLIGKSQSETVTDGREPPTVETKVSPGSVTGFDERLLSDLIETYGEFTVKAKLSEKTEAPQAAKLESGEFQIVGAPVQKPKSTKKQPADLEVLSTPDIEQSDSEKSQTLPALVLSPEPEDSKSHEPLATSESEPFEREQRAPAIRKHGELDRQLKSIIKDYGEYDLYSHRSSMNFKTAAIGAFAVLALVLGGFYFFKVPSAPPPAAVSKPARPNNLPATAKPDAGARSANTSNSNKNK